jgi:hypothetical protein
VERAVPFVRESFFRGEVFADLADAQYRGRGVVPHRGRDADPRHHSAAAAEVFEAEEAPVLLALSEAPYDLALYAEPRCTPTTSTSPRPLLHPWRPAGEHVKGVEPNTAESGNGPP